MLFNHDFYRPYKELTLFDKCVSFDLREDNPLVFKPSDDGTLVLIDSTDNTDAISTE